MKLPRNRFSLLSALWFAGGIYSLLFKAADTAPPPFPHFDKAAHLALFSHKSCFWPKHSKPENFPSPTAA
ncbi:VanZ family protein [Neisseria gonorrhoeae]|uniref:VanZ family protein n=1 Tax=Neisseria gonorrhoeae TaxID=485 RepID=A0A378VYS1_NEIGO|nr:VanZ family protein [Neisseria gonorrhoeae]